MGGDTTLSGISTLGGMYSYLGVPESLEGAKTKVFFFVRECLQKIINGWTSKFLSKGRKQVLIKLVGATLPTYVISTFQLQILPPTSYLLSYHNFGGVLVDLIDVCIGWVGKKYVAVSKMTYSISNN